MNEQGNDVSWLISNFVDQTPGVVEAIVVSSDGLLMAMSNGLDRAGADRFAAVTSGLIGLAYGAAGRFGGGNVNEVIVEMDHALLLVTGISDGSSLGVVANSSCDIGFVGYEMAVLVDKAGRVLTPQLRQQLVSALPQ